MSLVDQVSLFLHVVAAAFMVGGGTVQVVTGVRLRRATTTEDIAQWASLVRTGGWITLGAAVVSLFTGGHLAGAVWGGEAGGFANPFITMGMAGLLLLAPVGPMLGGSKLRTLLEHTRHSDTASNVAALRRAANSPTLWGPVHSLVGVALGLIWVMQHKPSWLASGLVLLGSFAVGWLSGVLVAGRRRTTRDPASPAERSPRRP